MARKKRRKYEEVEYYSLSPETKRGIIIVFLFAVSLICILSFLNLAGVAGTYVDLGLGIVFGWGRYLLPLILILLGYGLSRPNSYSISIPNYIGIVLFILSIHSLLHLKVPPTESFELSFSGLGGGVLGYVLSYPLIIYLGFWASLVILLSLLFASVLLMFNTSIEAIFEKTSVLKYFNLPFLQKKEESDEDAEDEDDEEGDAEEELDEEDDEEDETIVTPIKSPAKALLNSKESKTNPFKGAPRIKIDLPINLLDSKVSKPTSGDTKLGAEKIQKTLENFNIDVEMGDVQVGPTVTQYTFKPSEGVKLSRITSLNNDLALALAAHPVRIEAPIPGKSLVGIEVPNQKPAMVRMKELLESKSFKTRKSNLELCIGKDVSGKAWTGNLATMPHLLVAGATGSGKSVCLNSIILSLLYQNNTDTLRFIMVDPKRVEFPIYNGIPHLLAPVITDVTKTVYSLRWAITEMDRRFDELSKVNKRNIESYNMTAKDKMPYIVIIIDELADLMVAAAAEVEACIIRLTQMARAVGIHLIVATQRPSVDVITGLIKANIPCRIAFSVASLMDSRTILDSSGAEKLVGKGDMLYMSPQASTSKRLQAPFVSDDEIKRVVAFLKNQSDDPEYMDEITEKPKASGSSFDFKSGGGDGGDELFDEAKQVIVQAGKASASLLQRRLRIGYARAARLIDLLEEAGIVGPADGARPRELLMDASTMSEPAPVEEIIEEDEDEEDFDEDENDEEENESEETPEDTTENDEYEDDEPEDDNAEDELEEDEAPPTKKSTSNEIY
jgi:DNA segregation ATPase FtsK/SpoIIIE, S-DNA-T family